MGDRGVVDKSKLTQRELLLLLSQEVEGLREDFKELKKEVPDLRTRVAKMETERITWGVAITLFSGIIAFVINYFKN